MAAGEGEFLRACAAVAVVAAVAAVVAAAGVVAVAVGGGDDGGVEVGDDAGGDDRYRCRGSGYPFASAPERGREEIAHDLLLEPGEEDALSEKKY